MKFNESDPARVLPTVLERCHSASDGECSWKQCPQLQDDEPGRSGRHCPLDTREDDE